MNIKDAKKQIENAIKSYLAKDKYGEYRIPSEKQRPVFLFGAPGIGKTAIMEQLSKELGIGLVSYSMTHHTRQSAIGLPMIVKKDFGGRQYSVSEYTMSEIIASIYEYMEKTGIREGILFLDEINCVSETLAPSMLQFLQYKIFGGHKVPAGWIVVTAGNPPEYNKSVREFDIVTMDRLKLIRVEEDFAVWKEYAYAVNIHGAVISYLDIKKGDFFVAETTADGMNIVTPRAWEDLSEMIAINESLGITVDEDLISQYLQNKKTAKEFAVYYDLYNKYKNKYQVRDILNGTESEDVRIQASRARFDERLSLIALILEEAAADMTKANEETDVLTNLKPSVKKAKNYAQYNVSAAAILETERAKKQSEFDSLRAAGTLTGDWRRFARSRPGAGSLHRTEKKTTARRLKRQAHALPPTWPRWRRMSKTRKPACIICSPSQRKRSAGTATRFS
jgi:MoxR-like ATPase